MKLKDTKAGQVVNIWCYASNQASMSKEDALKNGGHPLLTHIISNKGQDVTCGWKSGEIMPVTYPIDLTPDLEKEGYILCCNYNCNVECEFLTNQDSSTRRAERQCKICHRMNDIGVKKCWMCEQDNP